MPFGLGPVELIIILVIVILVFGAGRIANIGGALGKSIREFKKEAGAEDGKKEVKGKKASKSKSDEDDADEDEDSDS